jgi:endoglucanase
MRARIVIAGAAVVAALAAWFLLMRPPGPDDTAWRAYKQRFLLAEGRIADSGNGGVSHTEGQGYAMVMATAYQDKATFDSLWGWTRKTLRRPDGLFSWKYVPNSDQPIPDANDASDGDLMICWGLLRAAKQWNRTEDRDAALDIAAVLRRKLVVIDGEDAYLLPGAEGFLADGKRVVNLSYWVFPALKDIAVATGDPVWKQVIETGLKLIGNARFGDHQLPPDWLETSGVLRPAEGFPPRFGYDAVRIPLYLLWGRAGGSEQLGEINAFWNGAGDKVPAWVDLTSGTASPELQAPGMSAVSRLTLGLPLPPAAANDDYYSASLWMLATLAKKSDADP